MGMMDCLAAPKMPSLMKMSRLCTPWLCVVGGIACEVGISFGAVQSILTDILGMSEVLARWVPRMLPDGQKGTRIIRSTVLINHTLCGPPIDKSLFVLLLYRLVPERLVHVPLVLL